VRPRARVVLLVAALVVAGLAPCAGAQEPFRRPRDPQELQEPRRAPLTVTPSLTVAEEYNDNILLNNDDRRWDVITQFSPGIALEVGSPTYRLTGSYFFTAEVFARHPELNHAFDRHHLTLDGVWRPTPRLTLTLGELFSFSTDTNLITTEGVATGRDRAFSNALTLGAAWLLDPRTTLRGGVGWALLRFDRRELIDSDTYRADAAVDHAFTPRVTGTGAYEVARFVIQREPDVTTHTPRLGVRYRFTETLTGVLLAGPTVELIEGDGTRVTPAITAGLHQRFRWGTLSADYTRAVGTAGGLGGPTVNQSVGLFAQLTTLARGLVVEAGPRYSRVESHDDRIDVDAVTVPLQLTYRMTSWAALVVSYVLFHQRSDTRLLTPAGTPLANDVDQNRFRVGLQLGLPVRLD